MFTPTKPVDVMRSLSMPSVVTLKCPSEPVSITSADVLPSSILSVAPLPPPPLIVIVFVDPVPVAVTPAPTKFNISASVDKGLPSSWIVMPLPVEPIPVIDAVAVCLMI